MSTTRTILLVEDEESITEPLTAALGREGWATYVTPSAKAAPGLVESVQPDLVLLDVMLEDGSGFDVCREIRQKSRVPIIMLTARGEELDRVIGLELGADDNGHHSGGDDDGGNSGSGHSGGGDDSQDD